MTREALDWLYKFRIIPWVVAVGLLLTLAAPQYIEQFRYWAFPVVRMQGVLLKKADDFALIHIYGEKLRGVECRLQGVQAFGDRVIGMPIDLFVSRVDIAAAGVVRPAGMYDIGHWMVRPVTGVTRARVYVLHDCDGYRTSALIAEVTL